MTQKHKRESRPKQMESENNEGLGPILQKLLEIGGLNQEFLSNLPLHTILTYGQENADVRRLVGLGHFWRLWVKKNVFPRHTDEFIERIPGNMRWRYYARIYGRFQGSELYMAQTWGGTSRFFPYRTLKGVTKIEKAFGLLLLLVDGKLAVDLRPGVIEEPVFYPPCPEEERYVDFRAMRAGAVNCVYLLTESGKVHVQSVLKVTSGDVGHDCYDFGQSEPTTLVNSVYVVKMTDRYLMDEKGDIYPFTVSRSGRGKLSLGERIMADCISFFDDRPMSFTGAMSYGGVPSPPQHSIALRSLSEDVTTHPLDIRKFYESLSFYRSAASTTVLTMDWTSETDRNTYFYLPEGEVEEEAHGTPGAGIRRRPPCRYLGLRPSYWP